MKHFLYGSVVACMSLATMAGFSSCSDDDDDYTIEIPSSVSSSLTADGIAGIYSFPIEANGSWTVSVEGEDAEWVYVLDKQGKDDATISFSIDDNVDGITRSAAIVVSNGSQSAKYTVTQQPASSNATTDVKYASSGLGRGAKMNPSGVAAGAFFTTNAFFNLRNFNNTELQSLDTLVYVTNSPSNSVKLTQMQEYNDAKSDISATLSIDVSFGLFKFGLSGDFHLYGSETDSNQVFQAVINNPTKILTLDYGYVAEKYLLNKNSLSDDEKKQRALIFSSTFLSLYDSIEALVAEGATFESDSISLDGKAGNTADYRLYRKMLTLSKNFSPLIIHTATIGGYVNVDFLAKNVEAKDSMEINGTLSASFSSTFSLDVKATAHYLNTMEAFSSGSELSLSVSGGSDEAKNNLIKKLGRMVSKNAYSADTIIDAASQWKGSITEANATTTTFSAEPVWLLFSLDAQDVLRNFFVARYPNNADGSCPYSYDIQQIAKEQ